MFVVLDGDGVVVLGDEAARGSRGIGRRAAARDRGRALFEAGDAGLTFLAYGTRDPSDMCWYPDSNKVAFRGLKVIARVEPLDYWDGEG